MNANQRKRLTRWSQNGTGYDPGSRDADQGARSRNPVESVALQVRAMEIGNGVTPSGPREGIVKLLTLLPNP